MENLGIDTKLIIAQGINFALFFLVFKRFLAKPFSNYVTGQRKKDQERERLMAQTLATQEKLEKQEGEMREKVKKESQALLAEAKKQAADERAELVAQAEAEAARIKESAQAQLAHEREQLEREAKEQIVQTSFLIVEKSLSDILTADMRKKVTEAILQNAPQKVTLYEN
jgi:F-type H+-transporting ATPase subunit b